MTASRPLGYVDASRLWWYTVNCEGDVSRETIAFHAYYANGVTAVEIQATSKAEARAIAEGHGWKVLHVFV